MQGLHSANVESWAAGVRSGPNCVIKQIQRIGARHGNGITATKTPFIGGPLRTSRRELPDPGPVLRPAPSRYRLATHGTLHKSGEFRRRSKRQIGDGVGPGPLPRANH